MSNDQFTWQSPFILQGMRRLFLAHQSDRDGKAAQEPFQPGLFDDLIDD
jgi:hypothetical protein